MKISFNDNLQSALVMISKMQWKYDWKFAGHIPSASGMFAPALGPFSHYPKKVEDRFKTENEKSGLPIKYC